MEGPDLAPAAPGAPEDGARGTSRAGAWALATALAAAGLTLRLPHLDGRALWNDEAWVALATRVEGWSQFWLAIAVTPPLFAALLRAWSAVPLPPETWLRLVPFAFGALTLWAAYRAGREAAASRLGGVLALGLLAVHPDSIAYSGTLKPYTAETCMAVLALQQAIRCARRGRRRDHVRLALVLIVGAGLSNAQILMGPPIAGALGVTAARRGGAALRRLAALGAALCAFDAVWYRVALAPRASATLEAYWGRWYLDVGNPAGIPAVALRGLQNLLQPAIGSVGCALAPAVVAVAAALHRPLRVAATVALLLMAELLVLSAVRRFPFAEDRTSLFAVAVLLVVVGASLGRLVVAIWARRARAVALMLLAGAIAGVSASRSWSGLTRPGSIEELGPLVAEVEASRRPDDLVLVYRRSAWVFAYYARPTPVLWPDTTTTVGYHPAVVDPRVRLVTPGSIARVLATTPAARVWFLGSRLARGDETAIRAALAARGPVRLERRAPQALLLRLGD